ncbi:electron transfer flavoprotein subunit beta/FixA family protein, partial [Clostridia bacterium OttesenSCG-928-F22]|nr:electron transfer flavoprotein subunit beta/FixA family protein [Clostridia bacterium OttesenSCG-928-F22]
AFGGSDTWATAYIISSAIRKIGDYDLIFCGRQAIDGDTAQVGPQIAENLGIPQITYVEKTEVMGGGSLRCQRALEDGYQVIDIKTPCLLTAIKELNEPRYASVRGIFDAYGEDQITIWTIEDVPVDTALVGLKGSPTNVFRTFTPQPKGKGIILEGANADTVKDLFTRLRDKSIL